MTKGEGVECGWTARRIACGGVTLNVVEAGPVHGPAVVLLHGFPEFWWGWRHQIGPLAAAGFRVIVPDQRGYGASDRPRDLDDYKLVRLARDVLLLVEALGRDSVSLVGHDWGGIVAFAAAARYPAQIERLAILNAPHPDVAWRTLRRDPLQLLRSVYVALFQIPHLAEAALTLGDHAALARAMSASARRGTFSADDLARYRAEWARPGALTAMLNWYRALVRRPPGAVGRIAVPTLMLWGRRDAALGPTFATESLRLCDEARAVWFDDATHWLQHEEAERVNAELVAFLGAGAAPALGAGVARHGPTIVPIGRRTG